MTIKSFKITAVTALFLVLLVSDISYSQSTVFVQADQFGGGILKTRGTECFVIAPNHVLRNEKDPTEDYLGPVTIYGEGSVISRVEKLKHFIGDLAVLKFTGDVNQNCVAWKVDRDIEKVIATVTSARLEIREATGELTIIPVTIGVSGDQFISISPINDNDSFEQGMSGSSLFTEYKGKKVYLGMLQTVEDGSVGDVLKASVMEDIMSDFFDPPKPKRASNGGVSVGEERSVLGFDFELIEVRREGSLVELRFDVTSTLEDKEIALNYRNIKIFDENGREYTAVNIVIGNLSKYEVRYKLIHKVTVPFVVQFNDISSASSVAELLSVGVQSSRDKGAFEIRDLIMPNESGNLAEGGEAKAKVAGGIQFELINVDKTGTEVAVHMIGTSLDRDRQLRLNYQEMLLYDNYGSEVKAHNIVIANKEKYDVTHRMIHGIAIPIEIQFKNVSSSAETISLLNIGLTSDRQKTLLEYRGLDFGSVGSFDSEEGGPRANACSNVYVYWMKGFTQCDETVYVTNHGERMLALKQGERYKTVVCNEKEFDFAPKTKLTEPAYSVKRGTFELGKDYYFKIGCTMGYSKITLEKLEKGMKNIDKKGKYISKIKTFKIKEL